MRSGSIRNAVHGLFSILWTIIYHRSLQLRTHLKFQDYHNYHTALDGRRLAVSNEADITVYFMDDVRDDARWEGGRASIEGAGSAHMHVNNTMLLESDKLVYQGGAKFDPKQTKNFGSY